MDENKKSKIEELTATLEDGIRNLLSSEKFKNWLKTSSNIFYNKYSFKNAFLIYAQKPDATYVMGYEQWKNYGRNVNLGAKSIKIYTPLMLKEKQKGGMFSYIKKELNNASEINNISTITILNTLEISRNNSNGLYSIKINGKEAGIFKSDDEFKKFINNALLNKVPYSYKVVNVFDYSDVMIPEYLWVRSGYTNDEIAYDENGKIVTNKGLVRIHNTDERKNRFVTEFEKPKEYDKVKMENLLTALINVSNSKGVPVIFNSVQNDNSLNNAYGYYYRKITPENPKGYIVLRDNLSATKKCTTLLHEMAHADLHNTIKNLAKEMGEEKLTKEMKEIQAEAVAFSVASQYGIETSTQSFQYIARNTLGFEMEDLKRSLEVIYNETNKLSKEINKELDLLNIDKDLNKSISDEPLDKDKIISLFNEYTDKYEKEILTLDNVKSEIKGLLINYEQNSDVIDVIKSMNENINARYDDIDIGLDLLNELPTKNNREEQVEIIKLIDNTFNAIRQKEEVFKSYNNQFMEAALKSNNSIKHLFENDKEEFIKKITSEYQEAKNLSYIQLNYIVNSKYIKSAYSKLLDTNLGLFVKKAIERANMIDKISAKNGLFIEIENSEKWTDKEFLANGTLLCPKLMDRKIKNFEEEYVNLNKKASLKNEFLPNTNITFTIYKPNKNELLSYPGKIIVGNNQQKDFSQYIENTSLPSEVKEDYLKSLKDISFTKKIYAPEKTQKEQNEVVEEENSNNIMSSWNNAINTVKDTFKNNNSKSKSKAVDKSNKEI